MKTLKIVCFALGLLGWVRLLYTFLLNSQAAQPQPPLSTILISVYTYSILSTIIVVLLARKLKRSAVGWGIFSFFLPYIACLILPFLKEGDPVKRRSWWEPIGSGGNQWGSYNTTEWSQKTCGACGREVPPDSHSGQRCPHCGAYWGAENKKYK